MSQTKVAATRRSVSVTVVLVLTLIWGCGYAIEGGYLVLEWAGWLPGEVNDLADHITSMSLDFEANFKFIALFGMLFLVFGATALLAAVGLFWRMSWGRVLTCLVAVLAILLGLWALGVGPEIIPDSTNVLLGAAQVVFGVLALSILCRNQVEPARIQVLGLADLLVGLCAGLLCSGGIIELVSAFNHPETVAQRDPVYRFAALASLGGFVAGLFLVAVGTCLLTPGWKRFRIVIALLLAACAAQAALAAFALLGALRGHTRYGLLEAMLLVLLFPGAIVWLTLTATELWYLHRPGPRRVLEA